MRNTVLFTISVIILCGCGGPAARQPADTPDAQVQAPPTLAETSSVTPVPSIPPKVAMSNTQCALPIVRYNDNTARKEVTCSDCPSTGNKCVVYKHLSPFGISKLKMSPEQGEAKPWIKCDTTPVIYSDDYVYRCMCD